MCRHGNTVPSHTVGPSLRFEKKKEFLDEEILPCDSKRCVVSSRGRDFRVEWIYCHHLQELQVILIKAGPDFVHCFLPAGWLDSVGITSVSSRTATRLPHFWPCSRFNEATGNRPLNESISNWIGRKNETGSVNYHVNRHKRSQTPQEKKSPSGVESLPTPNSNAWLITNMSEGGKSDSVLIWWFSGEFQFTILLQCILFITFLMFG